MKNRFKLFSLILVLGMAASFTACSDDDDGNGNVTTNVTYITENTTWTSDEVHVLDKRTVVQEGVTLTIEPGTIIKGEPGTETNAKALIIAKGARINAVGTPTKPIIFTSSSDNITPEDVENGNIEGSLSSTLNSQWGGVLILGKAPISVGSGTTAQIEGIPSTSEYGEYGGNDENDDSGNFEYVSIRHGGADIGEGNEINGLSLGGVGSGTKISHIEIVANSDDGIEFFGGTVNVSDVVVWNVGDDGLDTDQGWRGTCDNFVVVTPGDNLLELDGIEGDLTEANIESFGYHTFQNGYLISDSESGNLMNLDPETSVHITNVFIDAIPADHNHIIKMEDEKDEDGNVTNEHSLADFMAGVSTEFTNVVLNVSDDVSNYTDGTISGVTAGTAPYDASQMDLSEFSGWSWTATAATGFPSAN